MPFSFTQIISRIFKEKKYDKIKHYQNLSKTEQKILEEIATGKSYHTIADELFISKEAVQKHIRMIYQKLQNKSDNKKL